MSATTLLMLAMSGFGLAYIGQATVAGNPHWISDHGKLTIEAICTVTPDKVGCWSFEGKDNPEGAKHVRDFFEGSTQSILSVPGKKNRYLLTRWVPTHPGDLGGISIDGKPQSQLIVDAEGGAAGRAMLGLVSLPLDPGQAKFDVTFTLRSAKDTATFELEFKAGEKSAVGNKSVEILRVEKIAPERFTSLLLRNSGGKQGWRVYVNPKNVRLNQLRLESELRDRDGKSFKYIDEKGNPAPEAKPTAGIEMNKRPMFMLIPGQQSDEQWFETNVNPEKMGKFKFTPQENSTEKVTFAGLSADPIKEGGHR